MTAESRPKCPVGRLPVSVSKIPGGGNLRRVKPINRNLVTTARQQACRVPLSAKNGTFSRRRRSFRLFPSPFTRETNPPLCRYNVLRGRGRFFQLPTSSLLSLNRCAPVFPSRETIPSPPFPSLEGGVNPSLSLCLSSSRHGFHKAVCTLAGRGEGGNKRHRNIKRGCAIAIIGAASSLLSVLKTS